MADADADFWQAHLAPGERLLWQGTPRANARLEWSGLVDGTASLFLFVAALIITAQFATIGGFWWLIPAVFLGYASWRAIGIHYWRSFERARSRYALTDRRALIARRLLGRDRVDSYPITPETPLDIVEAPDTADLHFAEVITYHDPDKLTWTRRPIGFEQILDAGTVLRIMQKIQAGQAAARNDMAEAANGLAGQGAA